MRQILVLIALVAFCAVPAYGQTVVTKGPLPVGAKVAWLAPTNVVTPADAQTFEPRFYRNGTPLTALTNVTCASATNPTRIECSAAVSASNADALNQVGKHDLTLSLFRQDVGEGPQSPPFVLTTGAGAPTGLRLVSPN